ncbi:hypothetical protein QVD17_11615 [Tagetes erecta]|uniref:Uncharacterized protein n=1 Tax=Tagetes erecta TaxID=13708 RepID=A0AAD8P2C2_TARER|nr:hypothetical protein QVD17_11615 [Tagetes erecta]
MVAGKTPMVAGKMPMVADCSGHVGSCNLLGSVVVDSHDYSRGTHARRSQRRHFGKSTEEEVVVDDDKYAQVVVVDDDEREVVVVEDGGDADALGERGARTAAAQEVQRLIVLDVDRLLLSSVFAVSFRIYFLDCSLPSFFLVTVVLFGIIRLPCMLRLDLRYSIVVVDYDLCYLCC